MRKFLQIDTYDGKPGTERVFGDTDLALQITKKKVADILGDPHNGHALASDLQDLMTHQPSTQAQLDEQQLIIACKYDFFVRES